MQLEKSNKSINIIESMVRISERGNMFLTVLKDQFKSTATVQLVKKAIVEADYIVGGDRLNSVISNDAKQIINQLFSRSASLIYSSFDEMETQYASPQQLRDMMKLSVSVIEGENRIVKDKIIDRIKNSENISRDITAYDIYQFYGNEPFGFSQLDLASCLLGLLLKEKKIEMYYSSQLLNPDETSC